MNARASAAGTARWPRDGGGAAPQGRVRAWIIGRTPTTDTLLLTHRNVYILPTGAGMVFALTLVVLLLASINYQLNLGYLLTFLLAGSAAVSMHVTHRTLRGLTLHLRPPADGFVGEGAPLEVILTNPDGDRHGIGLRLDIRDRTDSVWVDAAASSQTHATLRFEPGRRGRHALPAVIVETRFPLGLFRAWAMWRPASTLLAYPQPETPAASLPPTQASLAAQTAPARNREGGDTEGVRPWRRGDALNRIVWRKAARNLASGGELVTRDTASPTRWQLWLDWQSCHPLSPEARLGRLCAWVLEAERMDAAFGLRLPGVELGMGHGQAHRQQCLQALALWK